MFRHVCHSLKRPRFDIKLEVVYGTTLNLRKKKTGKTLSSSTENTLYCSDVYNLAQKLDNSVQIVKITGHT